MVCDCIFLAARHSRGRYDHGRGAIPSETDRFYSKFAINDCLGLAGTGSQPLGCVNAPAASLIKKEKLQFSNGSLGHFSGNHDPHAANHLDTVLNTRHQ